jgi:hypothetical protein
MQISLSFISFLKNLLFYKIIGTLLIVLFKVYDLLWNIFRCGEYLMKYN